MYTVKEIAAVMGMTEHTIRYYTDKGLVPSVRRNASNNHRLFDEDSVNWLSMIRCLRECGMPIEAIKEYCDLCLEGDATIERRYQIILEQKAAAKAQLEEAKRRVAYMCKKERHYLDIIQHHLPDSMNPDKWPTKSTG